MMLDYAHGLEYVHCRGLVFESLSLDDFHVTWNGKLVLSGMGLLRQKNLRRDSIDVRAQDNDFTGISSNIFAFGVASFKLFASAHTGIIPSNLNGANSLIEIMEIPNKFTFGIDAAKYPALFYIVSKMSVMERTFLSDICADEFSSMNQIIKRLEKLANIVKVSRVSRKTLIHLNEYEYPLKRTLEEIDKLAKSIDSFYRINQPVVDRLMDIYAQLTGVVLLPYSVVEDFSELVQRFYGSLNDRLDACDFGGSAAMCESAALTIADRNHSFHHQLDELMWNSRFLSDTSGIHQWRDISRQQSHMYSGERVDHPAWLLPSDEVRIIKLIANGSFGAVYWGKWLGTDVVMKKVLTDQLEARNRTQFQSEAELWFSLNHANVIKLYGACNEIGKQPVFVCERAVSGTLAEFLKGKSREEIWDSVYGASLGLQHLHRQGIVHGDLKGNNILVCENNFVKLADFGMSIVSNGSASYPTGKYIGAIRWKAPECMLGDGPTFASDIYSLGMCIIEVITGNFPWGTLQDSVVVYNVVRRELPPRPPVFNDEEWDLVTRMCQFDPTARLSVGAVVCLLYQLYAGRNSAHAQIEQEYLNEPTDTLELATFSAVRIRTSDFARLDNKSQWFIPSYQIKSDEYLGSGLFSAVYRVQWLGVEVVQKQLNIRLKTSPDLPVQFRQEFDVWSRLNHPNIAKLYGVGFNKIPFFVSELGVSGRLKDYAIGKTRSRVWRCLFDAARGLQYIHGLGIIHDHLNGSNILVFDKGITKLAGLSRCIFAEAADRKDGSISAICWQSPERIKGGKPSFSSDIYMFGMCIVEIITEEYPWGQLPDAAVAFNVDNGRIPARTDRFNDLEWDLIRRMCQFDPFQRISIDSVVCWLKYFTTEQ